MLFAKAIASLAFLALLVEADHFTCGWQPTGNKKPDSVYWESFCTATLSNDNHYVCGDATVNGFSVKGRSVGVYNQNGDIMGIGTPCGKGGFGFDPAQEHQVCLGRSWLICATFPNKPQECFAENKADDCAWGNKGKASALTIWYYE
ncbi:unnamed protein product [Parajaminaea phylloscopi]